MMFSEYTELKWMSTGDNVYTDVLMLINPYHNNYIELLKIKYIDSEYYTISHSDIYQTGVSILFIQNSNAIIKSKDKNILKKKVENILLKFAQILIKFCNNETEERNETSVQEKKSSRNNNKSKQ